MMTVEDYINGECGFASVIITEIDDIFVSCKVGPYHEKCEVETIMGKEAEQI